MQPQQPYESFPIRDLAFLDKKKVSNKNHVDDLVIFIWFDEALIFVVIKVHKPLLEVLWRQFVGYRSFQQTLLRMSFMLMITRTSSARAQWMHSRKSLQMEQRGSIDVLILQWPNVYVPMFFNL
jgi:hypothetical protein